MFDPTKPVQTKSGLPAKILHIIKDNAQFQTCTYPIYAVITKEDGSEKVLTFDLNGDEVHKDQHSCNDLINIPDVTHTFLNVYVDKDRILSVGSLDSTITAVRAESHLNERNAIQGIMDESDDCVGRVHFEYASGQPLKVRMM